MALTSNLKKKFFWPHCMACGILVPQSGIEPRPYCHGRCSLNHWTVKEVPLTLLSLIGYEVMLVLVVCKMEIHTQKGPKRVLDANQEEFNQRQVMTQIPIRYSLHMNPKATDYKEKHV